MNQDISTTKLHHQRLLDRFCFVSARVFQHMVWPLSRGIPGFRLQCVKGTTVWCKVVSIIPLILYAVTTLLLTQQCSKKATQPGPPVRDETLNVTYAGSELWSNLNGIVVQENFAFCALDYGLEILDVGDVANPTLISKVFLPCGALYIAVGGGYAYVHSKDRLSIIDVSPPEQAHVVGELDSPCDGGIAARDGYVYLPSTSVLSIIDATNPALPVLEKKIFEVSNNSVIAGDYLYVTGFRGLIIFDISHPESPELIGGQGVYLAQELAVSGNTVAVWSSYCASEYPGECWGVTRLIDISNPAAPRIVGIYPPGGNGPWAPRMDLAFANGFLIQSASGNCSVIDVTNPEDASLIGTYDPTGIDSGESGIAVSGDHIFIPGLEIVSIANPASPALVGRFAMPGYSYNLAVTGQLAFVAAGNGLQIVDIADPHNPFARGEVTTPSGWGKDVAVRGQFAYLVDYNFEVVDVTDPDAPTLIGSCVTPTGASAVVVKGNYAYVADGTAGLLIMDITDNQAPAVVHSVTGAGELTDVAVSGSYAYLTSLGGELTVVNISDPLQSSVVTKMYKGGEMWGVDVQGSYAFVANGFEGLLIVDISNPAKPSVVSIFDTQWRAMKVTVSGGYAYISDFWYRCSGGGLAIIDISNPRAPFQAGHIETPGWARGVAVGDDFVFLVDVSGLLVLQVQAK